MGHRSVLRKVALATIKQPITTTTPGRDGMKYSFVTIALIALLCLTFAPTVEAQPKWVIGGNMGLSLYNGTAGFHFGPMTEAVFERQFAIGTALNINTQPGTPVEWPFYFKYFFKIPGSKIQPYADAGFDLYIYTGGPYFGLRFGGGANIPIARSLSIAPDLQAWARLCQWHHGLCLVDKGWSSIRSSHLGGS